MKIIYGGHWEAAPEGWLAYTEADQDITKPLKQEDNSIDVIFTEHVIEHVPLEGAINFMRESLRVLKPGGVFRVVAPMLDQIIEADLDGDIRGRQYTYTSLVPYYRREDAILSSMGLDGLHLEPKAFMFDSLLKKHGHQFVWTSQMMTKVLYRVGFGRVRSHPVRPCTDCCRDAYPERKIRGVNGDWLKAAYMDKPGYEFYDPESMIVHATKAS